ncbi:MAG TPA: DUF5615 family PIN-like protein [Anaerolineae bacterium]|nr:DUF5615 family PIN-like protein [Anaerolineae bacterium]
MLWVVEEQPGPRGEDVLAVREERIILTFDKDFGRLAFQHCLPATCGIMLLRFPPRSPAAITRIVLSALASRETWEGTFAVIDEKRIRLRVLPSARRT